MPKNRGLKESWLWILDHLCTEAQGGYGWRRRGVRGWRLHDEVEQALEMKIPDLPVLWREGLVDRTRVEDPGRSAPFYLYRISPAGNIRLSEEEGQNPPLIMEPLPESEDPEVGTLFVPTPEWELLALLQGRDQNQWMTAREIARSLGHSVGESLVGLRAKHLVERRRTTQEGGATSLWLYRASETGFRAELVDAVPVLYEPPRRVQVRIRAPLSE